MSRDPKKGMVFRDRNANQDGSEDFTVVSVKVTYTYAGDGGKVEHCCHLDDWNKFMMFAEVIKGKEDA